MDRDEPVANEPLELGRLQRPRRDLALREGFERVSMGEFATEPNALDQDLEIAWLGERVGVDQNRVERIMDR